jgi:hypothetical protein
LGYGAECTGWRRGSSGQFGYGRSNSGASPGSGQPDAEPHAPADRHRPRFNLAKTGDAGQQYAALYNKSEYAEYSWDRAQRLAVWIVARNTGGPERRVFQPGFDEPRFQFRFGHSGLSQFRFNQSVVAVDSGNWSGKFCNPRVVHGQSLPTRGRAQRKHTALELNK